MNAFSEFSLPIKGLKNGNHSFNFQIDKAFFEKFEGSPIENGTFDVQIEMDKREHFFELTFDFEGSVKTECDRCTAAIDLPFSGTHYLSVKASHETHEEDIDIVWISLDESSFNVAKYIYEFICVSMPYNKTYDCENDETPPCDFEVLKHISGVVEDTPSVSEEKTAAVKNPFSNLKDLFN